MDTPLGAFLERNQLKQNKFAAEIDISEAHLSTLISGKRRPSIEVVNRILGVCRRYEQGIVYEDLFGSDLPTAANET